MPQPTLNTHVVQTFARKAALICPQHAQDVVALANVPVLSQATTQEAMAQCASVYGAGLDTGKPFIFSQGIAVIPVWGALLHRSPWMSPYATGYEYIGSRFAQAMSTIPASASDNTNAPFVTMRSHSIDSYSSR